jgi:hypothetical protein
MQMAGERLSRVQFLGGPFDGHVQSVRLHQTSLAKVAALPVSSDILQMLGSEVAPQTSATSEALYRLDETAHEPRYRFIKSVAPVETA